MNDLEIDPLKDLIEDDTLTEIHINGPGQVSVEYKGRIEQRISFFDSEAHLKLCLNNLCLRENALDSIDMPFGFIKLVNGSRISWSEEQGITLIEITKNRATELNFEMYKQWGVLNESIIKYLKEALNANLNILISGNLGSGKFSLLDVLTQNTYPSSHFAFISTDSLVLSSLKNCTYLQTNKNSNSEDIKMALNKISSVNSHLVMSTINEGAWHWIKKVNTLGLPSLSTILSDSPTQAIRRLISKCQEDVPQIPKEAILEQMSTAFDVVIQLDRYKCGQRKITMVAETEYLNNNLVLNELFKFENTGLNSNLGIEGVFKSTKLVSKKIQF